MSGSTTGSQTGNFVLGNLLAPPGSYVDPTQAKDSFMPKPKDGQPSTRQPWEEILMGGMGGMKKPNQPNNQAPTPGGDASQEMLDGIMPKPMSTSGKGGASQGGTGFMDILLK